MTAHTNGTLPVSDIFNTCLQKLSHFSAGGNRVKDFGEIRTLLAQVPFDQQWQPEESTKMVFLYELEQSMSRFSPALASRFIARAEKISAAQTSNGAKPAVRSPA